jgi:hypothetical protein
MSTTSKNAQSATHNSLSPSSRVSGDAGALELSIESAWTRDDFFVAGVELSESQRAEPPTGDLLSAIAAEGALGAPEDSSPPLISVVGNDLEIKLLIGDENSYGSEPMSISPLLGNIAGLYPRNMSSPVTRQSKILPTYEMLSAGLICLSMDKELNVEGLTGFEQ